MATTMILTNDAGTTSPNGGPFHEPHFEDQQPVEVDTIAASCVPRDNVMDHDDPWIDLDDPERDAQGVHKSLGICALSWTCWCPAMLLFMLVIGTVVLTNVITQNKNNSISSMNNDTKLPTEPPLDSAQLQLLLQERLQVHSSSAAFLQVTSPQAQALQRMLSDQDGSDKYRALLQAPNLEQRFALLVFAMSCGVNDWNEGVVVPWTKMDPQTHECDWDGVQCTLDNSSNKVVTSIQLPEVDLVGTLPAELAFLTHITSLDFSNNRLEGALPDALFGIGSLESFVVSYNKLAFSINPLPVWKLTNLKHLKLDNNFISGQLPTELKIMTTLETFDATGTTIQGPIFDFISSWTNAVTINLDSTLLTGTIPSTLADHNDKLRFLSLKGISLTGTIPTELGLLTLLTALSLGEHGITINHAEDSIFSGKKLLEGTIPSELGNMKSLSQLFLETTNIEGTLPSSLGRLTDLYLLYMDYSLLNGTIPDEYANLKHLRYFSMSHSNVGGAVPAWLADLVDLEVVDMVGANYIGTFPEGFCPSAQLAIHRSCNNICACCDLIGNNETCDKA